MDKKKKVLFLLYSLGGGGAERVLVNLVNNMDLKKYDIHIQTIFKAGVNKEFLSRDIKLIESGWKSFKGISILFKLIPSRILFKLLIKNVDYNLMVAYLHGAPTKVLAGYPNKKTRKIAWLHTDMRRSTLNRIFFSKDEIIKTFNLYDRIVGVSSTVSNSFIDMYGLKEKVVVKYNTNNIREIIRLSKEQIEEELFPKNTFTIISIGSLTKVKGYSRLLSICKKLFDEGVKFKLYILGKGSEEKKLQDFINKNNLSKKITLLGFKKNPYPYLKKATLFVCSSIYEGLSTVISEAIILGVPVISTRVSGAEEVLGINNEYGIVVENNQEALYQGLKELIKSPKKVEYYKKKASERATFFDTEKRVKEVEDMFDEVLR